MKRIKDLSTTAMAPSSDDYFLLDGTTNGTRKILADLPISTATQSELNNKANLSGANFSGNITATNLSGTNTGDQDLSGLANDSLVVHLAGTETITGTKTFSNGVELQKGSIAFGQYSPLPTGLGAYVAQYVHPTYGARILGHNGSTYQDLNIGAMPTAGTFSMKLLANGTVTFGYGINLESRHHVGETGEPAFQNGWVAGFSTIAFYKDNFGIVHLEGSVKNPTSPSFGSTIFTLPSGYTPSTQVLIPAGTVNGNGYATIFILPNGQVNYGNGWFSSNTILAVDGVTFRP